MQTLIDIYKTYCENWGFKFSSARSEVQELCSSKCATIIQPLKLYGAFQYCRSYNNKACWNYNNAGFNSISRKVKSGIYLSLLNNWIVLQMCYPKALFSCGLWYGLSNTERSHKYICNILQGLPGRLRFDKCTSLLAWLPVKCYINKCKLQLFGFRFNQNSR